MSSLQKQAEIELKELRNKSFFGFFMLNALFVLIVFLLQLNKDDLHIDWPLGIRENVTIIPETQEVTWRVPCSCWLWCSWLPLISLTLEIPEGLVEQRPPSSSFAQVQNSLQNFFVSDLESYWPAWHFWSSMLTLVQHGTGLSFLISHFQCSRRQSQKIKHTTKINEVEIDPLIFHSA